MAAWCSRSDDINHRNINNICQKIFSAKCFSKLRFLEVLTALILLGIISIYYRFFNEKAHHNIWGIVQTALVPCFKSYSLGNAKFVFGSLAQF